MQISQRDKRLLLILGPAVAVAVAVFVLLVAGGSEKGSGPSAPTVAAGTNTNGSAAKGATSNGHQKPASTLVFSGRDPFQALVSVPTVTGGTPAPTSSTAPTVSPAPSPSPAPADGSSTTIDGHTVVLDDIFTASGQTKVQVEVDGAVYTIQVGDTFATSYKLVSVNGSTANFLYGDQPFSLTQPQPSGS
jgi:hypothetical protein